MTPSAVVSELVAVTERLIELIAAETELLQLPEAPDLSAFVPEKSKLSVRYDTLMRDLARFTPAELETASGFAALVDLVGRLSTLAEANAKAIDLRLKATRRVLNIIARAARLATQPTFSYGGGDRIGHGTRIPAVAINRVL
jgi:hypothetical protein